MKRITLAFAATLVFASCGDAPEGTTTIDMPKEETKTEETTHTPGAKIDPICEMEKDSTWTEYTVYKNDTVWFCSDVCKGAFLKNPDKYTAKLN